MFRALLLQFACDITPPNRGITLGPKGGLISPPQALALPPRVSA